MKNKKTDGVTRLLNIGSGLMSACAGLVALMMILYSGYVLYDSLAIEASAFSSNSDLLKYKPSVMAEGTDRASLADINQDYRGWITVDSTPIDYPIVQGTDDLYYASHDVNREISLTGSIYLATDNRADFSDSYSLLYGHHMDSGAMFGSLDKYRDESWFSSHRTATVTAKDGTVWDVTFFAVANTDAYESQIYTVGDRADEVKSFLTGKRDGDAGIGTKVLIHDGNTAAGARKILALSTCASADTNGRLVVFGTMEEHEEPTEAPAEATPTPAPTQGSHAGGATATPAPAGETVKLTVKYLDDHGTVFPEQVYYHMPGESYYVVSPQKPGYEADIEIVQGIINNDLIIIVHYTPKTYHLTIRYLFADGTEALDAYVTAVRTGEAYDLKVPAIPGYRASRLKIAGVNPGRDEQYTVIFIPEDWEEYSHIDDYDTPLNPGFNDLQIGVCAE